MQEIQPRSSHLHDRWKLGATARAVNRSMLKRKMLKRIKIAVSRSYLKAVSNAETSNPPVHSRDIYNSLFPAGKPIIVRTPSSCIILYYILFETEEISLLYLQRAQRTAKALRWYHKCFNRKRKKKKKKNVSTEEKISLLKFYPI